MLNTSKEVFSQLCNFTDTETNVMITKITDFVKNKRNIKLTIPSHVDGKQVYLPDSCFMLFYNCTGIIDLDISHIVDTSNVDDISYMFYECSNLKSLKLPHFKISLGINTESAFNGCPKEIVPEWYIQNLEHYFGYTDPAEIISHFSKSKLAEYHQLLMGRKPRTAESSIDIVYAIRQYFRSIKRSESMAKSMAKF